jgi:hypothetical protein
VESAEAGPASAPATGKRAGRRLAHFGRKNGSSATAVSEAGVESEAAVESQPAVVESDTDPAGSAVDELFAKLRSAQDTAAETPAQEAPEPSVSDSDEALLQKRESVIVDLEVNLTRKLKRALQDEQNDLLDRLRGLRGEVTAERVLPDPQAQAARYTEAAHSLAEQAAAAGARFAAETLGRKRSTTEHPSVDDLVDEAANNVVEPLRRRLEQAISRSAEEDQTVLVESLGSAYREWKSQRVERVAGDLLAAAFARGTWQATPPGTTMRWIVEDVDGPCPDCDDDALAGTLPKEEAFPTGQHHPPAHTGCRCLLVPSAS